MFKEEYQIPETNVLEIQSERIICQSNVSNAQADDFEVTEGGW